jgi:hypothetical protein
MLERYSRKAPKAPDRRESRTGDSSPHRPNTPGEDYNLLNFFELLVCLALGMGSIGFRFTPESSVWLLWPYRFHACIGQRLRLFHAGDSGESGFRNCVGRRLKG